MAKKKKFGLDDILELTGHAAAMVGNFTNAQKAAQQAFEDGNSTNLNGAEGGPSKAKPKTGRGVSQLALDEIEKYRKY